MTYSRFALYNCVGGALWVTICLGAGYLFGNIPVVRANFSLVVLAIIAISVLPAVFEMIRVRRSGCCSSTKADVHAG